MTHVKQQHKLQNIGVKRMGNFLCSARAVHHPPILYFFAHSYFLIMLFLCTVRMGRRFPHKLVCDYTLSLSPGVIWGQASFSSRTRHVFPLTRPLATQPAEQADLRHPAPSVSHEAGASHLSEMCTLWQDVNKERIRETRSQRS